MKEQEQNGKATSRIEYIDIAKGVGILLVVFGHIVWGGNYEMPYAQVISNSIYSFHMPLFFIISGLCIKDSKILEKKTIRKMVKVYLVPYAIWTVIYLLLFQGISIVKGQGSIINLENVVFDHDISICGVAPLWFLLALFIAEAFTLLIKPFLQKKPANKKSSIN